MTGSGKPTDAHASPRPTEADVRLSVFWHGLHLEFAACTTAAHAFVKEWRSAHYGDAVEVFPDGAEVLPRLPCERLYLDP
ncbi:hypothetical protein IU459_25800 [Nocardia amamiensis]|uniref:Uncharacterized protein n=1 Tax=Nocardia amamiensis TaxID=404578 RepID=A0ABS0CYJ9_9NOCA|nr:hypothetical protein [Nocardia amamiensis]MBF6300933.1 hypothetical protein [Nocardia amamiensis]